jgi:hypothetical protein
MASSWVKLLLYGMNLSKGELQVRIAITNFGQGSCGLVDLIINLVTFQ